MLGKLHIRSDVRVHGPQETRCKGRLTPHRGLCAVLRGWDFIANEKAGEGQSLSDEMMSWVSCFRNTFTLWRVVWWERDGSLETSQKSTGTLQVTKPEAYTEAGRIFET